MTQPPAIQVTEAMIEAGVSFVCGADHTFGKSLNGEVSLGTLRQDVADLYLAMHKKQVEGVDVERIMASIEATPPLRIEGLSLTYGQVERGIRAALNMREASVGEAE